MQKTWRDYIYYEDDHIILLCGDVREIGPLLPKGIAQTCVTSPPYFGLRNYGDVEQQIGLEATPSEFIAAMVDVFGHVKRALVKSGTLFVNLGDSYNGQGQRSPNIQENGTRARRC